MGTRVKIIPPKGIDYSKVVIIEEDDYDDHEIIDKSNNVANERKTATMKSEDRNFSKERNGYHGSHNRIVERKKLNPEKEKKKSSSSGNAVEHDDDCPMFLGRGAYGNVSISDGKAMKKFSKLSHLIQEYGALKYLSASDYIVNLAGPRDINVKDLTLSMELYDTNLSQWLVDHRSPKESDLMLIIKNILFGLVDLHDRGLAHGDLKLGNILLNNQSLRTVIGDCGFTSIARYSKLDRTAEEYRDPIVGDDTSHDIYSLGICMLQLFSGMKLNKIIKKDFRSYRNVRKAIDERITDPKINTLLKSMVKEDKKERPTARKIIEILFGQVPLPYEAPSFSSNLYRQVTKESEKLLRTLMKKSTEYYRVNRGKHGFEALINLLRRRDIPEYDYSLYAGCTIMILSSIFGKNKFGEKQLMKLTNDEFTTEFMNEVIVELLNDQEYLSIIFSNN